MYLLPKEHPATKKILDSPTTIPCDIYIDNHMDCVKQQQIDDFMRFVEAHLNKLKKSQYQRTKVSVLPYRWNARQLIFNNVNNSSEVCELLKFHLIIIEIKS